MSNHLTAKHTPLYVDLDLSIIIPAYNEEQRITPTIESISAFLATQPYRYEIVVVDDGSKDGTVALCRKLAERIDGLRVIATSPNRGKGHAVRVGMLAGRGAVRVMCDADGSRPATELPKLLAPIASGKASIAIGSRYVEGAAQHTQPMWRRLWSRLCNKVIQAALVPGVRDTQCGFKVFRGPLARQVFADTHTAGFSFDVEVLGRAQLLGARIAEFPVTWVDVPGSTFDPARHGVQSFAQLAGIALMLRRAQRRVSVGAPVGASVTPLVRPASADLALDA